MCNPFASAYVAFVSSAAIGAAMTIKPLPKIRVDSLNPQTFDAVYLDRAPVILVGSGDAIATACPAKLRFSAIEQSCSGWVQGKYVKTKATNEGEEEWAGLKDGTNEQKVDFLQYIKSMGKQQPDKPPRFMFDVPMRNLCPSLLTDIHIPPQFVGIFESQFLWRHFQDDNQKCAEVPFMNMYLAEALFETDLHIDSANTAFFASMCEGRKKWRIISPQSFAQFHSELAMPNTGRFIEGKWVNAEIKRPFETWADSSRLNSLDVTVYEGILEEGEILYIPPGAPHAAITLDHSIMLASNDQSIQSLDDIGRYCSEDTSWFGCGHYQQRLAIVQENHVKYTNTLKRDAAMTFAKAFDCETAVKRLARSRLEITPMNFHEEAQKGPMIVMKYDRSCLRCLHILDQLIENRIGESLIRFGVLNCPGGECDKSSNNGYNQLLQNVREELPEFAYVAPRDRSSKMRGTFAGSSSAAVSHYYGPIDLDFLKVWINMKASETLFHVSPWWWGVIIGGIHTYSGIVVSSLSIVGLSPSSDDVLLLCVMFVIFAVLATIVSVGIYLEGVKTSTLGEKKKV